jgi:hypothetical protein
MKIKAIQKYLYKGKEYNSLEEIKEEIHNIIGLEVLDKINRVCPPQKHKDFIKMLDVLCSPEVRKVLVECFNVKFDEEFIDEDGCYHESSINILDIK